MLEFIFMQFLLQMPKNLLTGHILYEKRVAQNDVNALVITCKKK